MFCSPHPFYISSIVLLYFPLYSLHSHAMIHASSLCTSPYKPCKFFIYIPSILPLYSPDIPNLFSFYIHCVFPLYSRCTPPPIFPPYSSYILSIFPLYPACTPSLIFLIYFVYKSFMLLLWSPLLFYVYPFNIPSILPRICR